MNAIMAWCAGYESGVCTSPRVDQESRTSAASPEFAQERVAKKSTIHRAETSSVKAVKIKD